MLYGVIKGNTLVLGAADTLVEFDTFAPGAAFERPDVFDMMGDAFYSKLSTPPYLFDFDHVDGLAEFALANNIQILGENRLASKSDTMKKSSEPDPYAHSARLTKDEDDAAMESGAKVTIASLHGISEEDRWDRRTPEQVEKAKKDKEEYDSAKKAGRVTGDDSFSNEPAESDNEPSDKTLHVTDVRVTRRTDGSFEVDNMIAVKGLYADDKWTFDVLGVADGKNCVVIVEKSHWDARKSIDTRLLGEILSNLPEGLTETSPGVFETDASVEEAAQAMEDAGFIFNKELHDHLESMHEGSDNDDPAIDPKGVIAIYFKLAVVGAKHADILPVLTSAGVRLDGLVWRNCSTGCWIAFIRKTDAEKAGEHLTTAGFEAEVFAVDDLGERLLAEGIEGVSIVDTSAPKDYGPRPWNARASEIGAMDEAALTAHKKSMEGEEFVFCGEYNGSGRGTVIHIAPKEYFNEHGEMFPGSLDISHLLPDDFKEIEPGVYKTMGRDLASTTHELAYRRKFIESMRLQLYLNNRD